MSAIMAGSMGGVQPPVTPGRLSIVSLVTNAVCPLRCAHCYLDGRTEPAMGLGVPEWERLIASLLVSLRPATVCFAGKEVFALPETARLLFDSIRERDAYAAAGDITRIGTITNGILLDRYREEMEASKIDWVDISVDGTRELHDAVRGAGAFDRMARSISWLKVALGDRLWATPTLMNHNIESLMPFIDALHRYPGFDNFCIGLYKPQSYTDGTFSIRESEREDRILRSLDRLATLRPARPITVRLDFDASEVELRRRLEIAGLIPRAGIVREARHEISRDVVLSLCTTDRPVGLWRSVRVTNTGQWLAAEDLVDVTGYDERSIGCVRDFGFDAEAVYLAGLDHPRFEALYGVPSHEFLGTSHPAMQATGGHQ